MLGKRGDGLVNRGSSLDKDDNRSGSLQREDEITRGVMAGEWELAFQVSPVECLVNLGCGTIVDGDRETLFGYVKGEVLAHDGQSR